MPLLPLLNLGNNVQLQRLSFSASKDFVLVNEIATEPPFLSTEFQGLLSPAPSLLVMFRTPGNLIGLGSGLLSQQVRRVSLLLPALVYYLSHLAGINKQVMSWASV